MSAIGLLTTLCFSCALIWLHAKIRTSTYEGQFEKAHQLVDSAWSVVNHYGKQADAGTMTAQQAQQAAIQVIRSLRYGKNNYFWINDMQPRMIMHPTNAALDGKDLSDLKDPNGVAVFVEMAAACRKNGGGSIAYLWAKPGSTAPVPKISYVKLYQPWGWVVGTGNYVDDVEAELRTLTWVFWAIAGLACALSLAFTYGLARSIARKIRSIVNDLMEGAHQVTAAASQVSTAAQGLARDASAQAASLQQTSASSEQILSMTRKNAANSEASASHMARTAQSVSDANSKLAGMKTSMDEINVSSGKISKIIKVIDEIAFQTNILALNAAVEAARAGEAGMGFAVVADEVRNLAQRSAQAARDTTSLIEESIAKSKEGGIKLNQVTDVIREITGSATKVKALVDEVRTGSQEQARDFDQITKTLTEMERLTQQAAASSEQSAAASQELSAQAESMRGTVAHLEMLIDGGD
jgi:methyl-accepting chemotaxis protein